MRSVFTPSAHTDVLIAMTLEPKNAAANPAKDAARQAQEELHAHLAAGHSVLLEAGAGSGKTYSLIEALKFLIKTRGVALAKNRQQIACITYTNVASDQIASRTDKHPVIWSSTIHAFCWALIKDFQPFLRAKVPTLARFNEKLEPVGGQVGNRTISYELGHRTVTNNEITLWHDDVIKLTVMLMEQEKFRKVMSARFPIIFVDEYQDTNRSFAGALIKFVLEPKCGPQIGFFGDHWQKIYDDVCGKIEHASLKVVKKGANFRSAPQIVEMLNKMRPELVQAVSDPNANGTAAVYHTNEWPGNRRNEAHWKGDLPEIQAHSTLEALKAKLITDGWEIDASKTKILMLTNNLLAKEQGYGGLAEVFRAHPEDYLNKNDPYIAFFTDVVEPVCAAYEQKHFGEMFSALNSRTPALSSHKDKEAWKADMEALLKLRASGTVADVIAHLRKTGRPRMPERLERRETDFEKYKAAPPAEADPKMVLRDLLGVVRYGEVIALDRYIDDVTPFSTKHGVKGAEFENVLVVVGRGWNRYDFSQFLEWCSIGVPADKAEAYDRNRNLFYVACSRPRKRLAILLTQKVSTPALKTLGSWFGENSVQSFPVA
jgi:DNA helicase II / ATP-dependent DNA helicase PcrA